MYVCMYVSYVCAFVQEELISRQLSAPRWHPCWESHDWLTASLRCVFVWQDTWICLVFVHTCIHPSGYECWTRDIWDCYHSEEWLVELVGVRAYVCILCEMYVFMYVCICVRSRICTYVCMYVRWCLCVWYNSATLTYMSDMCVYVCMYAFIRMWVCASKCLLARRQNTDFCCWEHRVQTGTSLTRVRICSKPLIMHILLIGKMTHSKLPFVFTMYRVIVRVRVRLHVRLVCIA